MKHPIYTKLVDRWYLKATTSYTPYIVHKHGFDRGHYSEGFLYYGKCGGSQGCADEAPYVVKVINTRRPFTRPLND